MSESISLGFSGGPELAAQLRKLSEAVRKKALLKILRVAAEPIRGRASELAPIDPSTDLDLKDWIVISATTHLGGEAGGAWQAASADEFQAAVAIGPASKVFYGLYLEFGTVHAPHAKPFLRPAFDYGTDRTLSILRDGLWDLLDDANTGAGVFEQ